eukprot:gene6253-7250_t
MSSAACMFYPPSKRADSSNMHPSSPSASSSPLIMFGNKDASDLSLPSSPNTPQVCALGRCLLCERGQPTMLLKTPTWASIMRVVFYTLHTEHPEKLYFSLKNDVYDFMTSHWDRLYIGKKRSDNWRKQVQDMLSHSKTVFESGMDKIKQNGFWRLKVFSDPWEFQEREVAVSQLGVGSPSTNEPTKKRSFDDTNYHTRASELVNQVRKRSNSSDCYSTTIKQQPQQPQQQQQPIIWLSPDRKRDKVAEINRAMDNIRERSLNN